MKQILSETIKWIGLILIFITINNSCVSKNNSETKEIQKNIVADSVSFLYTDISGIGYDSLYNRRDNSDLIKVGNKYYVWYTRMNPPVTSGYWGTIWYATSEDEGHTWQEQGLALDVGESGAFDSHSVFTPNILVYDGKYYLYYTAVRHTPGNDENIFENNSINDFTAIGLAVSDKPDGPFKRIAKNPVLSISQDSTAFDSYRIDDASLIIRNEKVCLYYKGRSIIDGKKGPGRTKMGVAIADHPEGTYTKHSQYLLEHSHEVLIWKKGKGIASLASINKTIQYAPNGLDFDPFYTDFQSIPKAPGLYRPFLSEGESATDLPEWGLCMTNKNKRVYLQRFEIKRKYKQ